MVASPRSFVYGGFSTEFCGWMYGGLCNQFCGCWPPQCILWMVASLPTEFCGWMVSSPVSIVYIGFTMILYCVYVYNGVAVYHTEHTEHTELMIYYLPTVCVHTSQHFIWHGYNAQTVSYVISRCPVGLYPAADRHHPSSCSVPGPQHHGHQQSWP